MKVINKITMKQLCLILTILILPTFGFGQFIGDSVIVYVDNRVEVKLAVPDYFALKSSHDAVQALENFIKVLPEIEDQLSADAPELVKFSGGGALTVEPGESRVIYLQKEGAFSNTGFRDQAIVSGKDYTIMITATDLSMISDLPLLNCLNSVIAILPEKRSWSRSLYYECIAGNVKELEIKNNEVDVLEINFGAGAGLVKNTWVPDLSVSVGLGLNKKGNIRLPYVSTNMLFDFSSEGKTNVNTFLNLGLVIATFCLLLFTKIPPPILILTGLLLGFLLAVRLMEPVGSAVAEVRVLRGGQHRPTDLGGLGERGRSGATRASRTWCAGSAGRRSPRPRWRPRAGGPLPRPNPPPRRRGPRRPARRPARRRQRRRAAGRACT